MTRFQKLFNSADMPVFKRHFWGYFGVFWEILGGKKRFQQLLFWKRVMSYTRIEKQHSIDVESTNGARTSV